MEPTNRGEIRRLKGNLRYRVLIINEEYYLIDIGASPWKVVFPFLFWIFKNPGYKIDKETALQLITNPKVKTGQSAIYGLIGGGISITFSSYLTTITDRLHIDTTIPINTIITIILTTLIILSFLFILIKLKKKVEKTINYSVLPRQEFKIYSPKLSHFIKISIVSLSLGAISVIFLIVFIQYNNLFILLTGLAMLLLFLLVGGAALDHGKYKIKIK
ncbi:DUF443 family protein [Terribacillus halophilus]|jgi:uncharacterized membrane protein (TIGR01218 family)|uniref:DUF443 family protein n=1 Tax=Terribacillus halophilus TaxID=361279 RepID=UPI0009864C98|nr:DUF443 family protein [Terribacillus halophilus]